MKLILKHKRNTEPWYIPFYPPLILFTRLTTYVRLEMPGSNEYELLQNRREKKSKKIRNVIANFYLFPHPAYARCTTLALQCGGRIHLSVGPHFFGGESLGPPWSDSVKKSGGGFRKHWLISRRKSRTAWGSRMNLCRPQTFWLITELLGYNPGRI